MPRGVTGYFVRGTPTEPSVLRSTLPLKVSTRNFSWGKVGRWVWLTTYHPCSAKTSRQSGVLIYPEPLGPPRPVVGDLYLLFHRRRSVLKRSEMLVEFWSENQKTTWKKLGEDNMKMNIKKFDMILTVHRR